MGTKATDGTSGPNGDTSGSTGNNQENNHEDHDTVSRAAYDKLLKEKRNLSESFKSVNTRLAELEAEREERTNKDAESKGEYQKVIDAERVKREAAEKKALEAEARIAANEERDKHRKKFSAVLRQLGGGIDEKFFPLIDVDDIAIDDEGNVDSKAVEQYANKLRTDYPEIIRKKNGGTPPNGLPGDGQSEGAGGKITGTEYRALPIDKMKLVKYADVDWSR